MTEQTDRLTDQQLNDIDARQRAATPGPWTVSEDYSDVLGPDGDQLASYWNPTSETRNGEFIAHARTDVPALLAEIRRLKGQRKYLISQLAKRDAESGSGDEALREFLAAEQPAVEDLADASNPVQLRWGLDDVMWGDDDSVIVMLSGPDGEPYWLELDPERAAVLRQNLAGPDGEETHVVADDSATL